MSHGYEKAAGGLLSIAFQNSKSLQKALADEGDDPAAVSRFMVKQYRAMLTELADSDGNEHDD
jgi:hypothetical protein